MIVYRTDLGVYLPHEFQLRDGEIDSATATLAPRPIPFRQEVIDCLEVE